MPVLGITGGVGTGKSTFTGFLRTFLPATVFDADLAARQLLETDDGVKQQVCTAFGKHLLKPDGHIDREGLREQVFGCPESRRSLESILHPLIRRLWMSQSVIARESGSWLLVDIPLLFETGVESAFDAVVVVACSEASQRFRLLGRSLTVEMAGQIISAQQSLASKIARAAHVVWSDSPVARLEEQAQIFGRYLHERYG